MTIELRPGQLLDQFLQRADPARQGDERVGAIEHRLLARMHRLNHEHFLGVGQRMLLADQEIRDDPGHIAAAGQRRSRQAPHQPFAAAAVNEADSLSR